MTKQNRNVLITGGTGILGSLSRPDTVAVLSLFNSTLISAEDVTFLSNVTEET